MEKKIKEWNKSAKAQEWGWKSSEGAWLKTDQWGIWTGAAGRVGWGFRLTVVTQVGTCAVGGLGVFLYIFKARIKKQMSLMISGNCLSLCLSSPGAVSLLPFISRPWPGKTLSFTQAKKKRVLFFFLLFYLLFNASVLSFFATNTKTLFAYEPNPSRILTVVCCKGIKCCQMCVFISQNMKQTTHTPQPCTLKCSNLHFS